MTREAGVERSGEDWTATLFTAWQEGQRLGAVGPGPVSRHLDHAAGLAAQLPIPRRAVDLGAGAGVPGLALAGLWPESEWVLVDAAARRVRLLTATIERLGWESRVRAVHGRAEDVARDIALRGRADLVTARSFGPPATTAECGMGFLAPSGLLVVSEPPDGTSRWPADGVARLGLALVPSPDTDTVRIQRLRLAGPLPDRYPRRAGVPQRRPLFGD